ncbi:GxxExxY protein [Luteolibacter pohnpeiensis]
MVDAAFKAQILTYLKLSRKSLGFLINFHVPLLKHGIKRFVNHHQEIKTPLP